MTQAKDTLRQIIAHIDEILEENPVPDGETSRAVRLVDDDALTLIVSCMREGGELKSHLHKTHAETEYFIRGTGQLLVGGRWVDIGAGSLHYNPAGAVHAIRNTGTEPLVVLILFTPGMRETDRHFAD
ncbi:MAG: cupin domain-containing protein [Syntrophales bacterium]|nr:cupin domain-containing protein [Syntrophales bacterium]